MEFEIVDLSPDEKTRTTYRFQAGVIGFYAEQKYVETWQQLKGWVTTAVYTGHTAISIPEHVRNQAIARFGETNQPSCPECRQRRIVFLATNARCDSCDWYGFVDIRERHEARV